MGLFLKISWCCPVFLHTPDFSFPMSGCLIPLGFYQVLAFSSEKHWEIFFITWALLLVLDMLNEDCQKSPLSDAKVNVISINLTGNLISFFFSHSPYQCETLFEMLPTCTNLTFFIKLPSKVHLCKEL